jgi:transcriptional regulator with XRE-family HTH domain
VGHFLRAARVAAGLTGQKVLSLTGIDPGNLCRMEQGARLPSLSQLLALAALYRVPLASLVEPPSDAFPAVVAPLSPSLPVAAFVDAPHPAAVALHERHWQERPDLRANARRFAKRVFEPVQSVLGVSLRVERGYRSPALDRTNLKGHAPFSAHTHGLAADVTPGAMPLRGALRALRAAVRRGDLPDLDFAAIESSRWLHIQAAPDGLAARRVIAPTLAG